MSETQSLYINALNESLKQSQRSILIGALLLAFSYAVDQGGGATELAIPLIGWRASSEEAFFLTIYTLYFFNGLLLLFSVSRAKACMHKTAPEIETTEAALHFPSLITASLPAKAGTLGVSIGVVFGQLYEASGLLFAALFGTAIVSYPTTLATIRAFGLNAAVLMKDYENGEYDDNAL